MKKIFYLFLLSHGLVACNKDADNQKNPDSSPLGLLIREIPVNPSGFTIQNHENFALWWDDQFDHSQDVASLKQWLSAIRQDVKTNLGMKDPPNTDAGFYYNIYIHHGEDDKFPNSFGNGQGFDQGDLPFLTLPFETLEDFSNIHHEGFHVFQTSGGYEAIDLNNDAVWFIEASAEWYQCSKNTGDNAFITAGSVYANPHFSLWYIPEFWDPNVPADNDWLFGVRQYGVSAFLYFLSNVKNVDRSIISGVYANSTNLSAQEYIYNTMGENQLRGMFADWAVQTAVGFDYLTPGQKTRTMDELNFFATSAEIKAHALELSGSAALGTFSPGQDVKPAAWGYNSIKITNPTSAQLSFSINGTGTGSDGAAAHFEGRIAVKGSAGIQYYDINMPDGLSGQITVPVSGPGDEVYLVISSVPQHFSGYQTFDYSVTISN